MNVRQCGLVLLMMITGAAISVVSGPMGLVSYLLIGWYIRDQMGDWLD